VLSLWPALPQTSQPYSWRALASFLKLGPALVAALPAAVVRAGLWLLWPGLLALALSGRLPLAVAVPLALLSLPLALLLDNQWRRLWRNRSERQRAALGLNGMQRVLRLPLEQLRSLGGGAAAGLGLALQNLGQQLPLWLADALPAAALLALSSGVLLLWQPALGGTSLAAVLAWLLLTALLLRPSAALRVRQDQERSRGQLRGQELLEVATALRLAGAEQRGLAWWRVPEEVAQQLQPRLDRWHWLWGGAAVVAAGLTVAVAMGRAEGAAVALALVGLQLGSAWQLGGQLQQLQRLTPSWRASQVLLACPSDWRPAASDPGVLAGALEVRDLNFRYAPDQPPVLEGVSFQVAPGSFVALVGASGSGKSTLLRLLLGFASPESGQILFDGRDAGGLQYELLRAQIGTVLQDTRLVGGTLFEVIAAGRSISLEQAWQAAELAGMGEELRSWPMGLQTLLAAGGSTLSGGQRQRLAIARALVGEPRLLLLDEPTSALDNRSQQQVLNGLAELAITRLLVAHRLSTVRQADWIVVLERGRLVQQGRFDQLLAQPGAFAQLMERQRL
jgi:ABC-type bacteriocin/lantibiotic exporter with double-glycine peptidase domain